MSQSTPRRASAPNSPSSTPPAPYTHSYESFADLVSTHPPQPRRGLFSSTSSSNTTPRRWRTSLGGSESDSLVTSGPRGGRLYGSVPGTETEGDDPLGPDREEEHNTEEARDGWELSTQGLICLTIGLAGAQLTWTVEMA